MKEALFNMARKESGFTLLELGVAGGIACVALLIGLLAMVQARKQTCIGATAEVVRQDLTTVSSMAETRVSPPEGGLPYRYCIKFNGETKTPSNSYCVLRGTPDDYENYTYKK